MTTYKAYHNVDYITYSTLHFQPIDDILSKLKTTSPRLKNYNHAQIDNAGTLIHWHDTRHEMKTHVTLSAKTLSNYREIGISDIDVIWWLKSLKMPKFGRIDIAVTSEISDGKHGFTPDIAWAEYVAGNCITRLTADKPVVDIEKMVETFYVGSRKSRNRILRIYDKGIELGEAANKIIRFELETRELANKIVDEIAIGHNIAGIIRRYVDYPDNAAWCEIMDCEPLPRYRSDLHEDRDIKSKIAWMLKSVAPAMADLAVKIDGNWSNEFWYRFTKTVAYHYNKKLDDNAHD